MANLICLVAALLCCAALTVVAKERVRYDNFRVYQVDVSNDEQLSGFRALARKLEVQSINDLSRTRGKFEVAIAPALEASFELGCQQLRVPFEVRMKDFQQFLDTIIAKWDGIKNSKMNWTHYHSLSTIYNWLDSLVVKYPLRVRPYIIGKSYEGRAIKAVKVSFKKNNKAIFIDSNIHAMEWISSATSTCFFNELLNAKRPELRELLLNYDWIFVPMINPDGFEYSRNVQPFWRKNRRPNGFSNSSGICYGVDMNRNFNYFWGAAGYNIDVPCDHWYGGTGPETEPEVQALTKFIRSFPTGYIRMYFALHSYGNLVLLPYGHTTTERPPNYPDMMEIAKSFATGAQTAYNTSFLYGASGELLNIVSGAAKDWSYGVAGIKFSTTIELRDRGTYGFFLPADQIQPVCDEFTEGMISAVKRARELNVI